MQALKNSMHIIWRLAKWSVLFVIAAILIGNTFFATPRDVAYRPGHPNSKDCQDYPAQGWTVLSEHGNDELQAIEKGKPEDRWEQKFRCTIQSHAIPGTNGATLPLHYHLAFLEFSETGVPYALNRPDGAGEQMSESPQIFDEPQRPISQLEALTDHLKRQKSNYVIVFAHGWRHDASIGDGNVANLRVYAAHAARFLADRCKWAKAAGDNADMSVCDTEVTGVFIGWRGARVDEKKLTRLFPWVGSAWGSLSAFLTLFDRKPVSEQVGPAVVTALQEVDRALGTNSANKMIVFGHSLGGNLFATALKDGFIKAVLRHDPGAKMASPIGDLVVLINPASEATNWTAIQRTVWDRIAYRPADESKDSTIADGHKFFPRDQPPVMIAVTAARSWPPGGIRAEDCLALVKNERSRALLAQSEQMADNGVDYDWATYDLFPFFKMDARPLATTLFRIGAQLSGSATPDNPCSTKKGLWYLRALTMPFAWAAAVFRNLPFMNTDQEQTHTIGNLDPPRPASGTLATWYLPARPFGTTHQLLGYESTGKEKPIAYAAITSAQEADCKQATNWLWRAREYLKKQNGTFWDSNDLELNEDGNVTGTAPAAEFIHGFSNAGMAAITRANDPFWNIRAFDNALTRHDGYMLSSFICAMNQLVMDDIAIASNDKSPVR